MSSGTSSPVVVHPSVIRNSRRVKCGPCCISGGNCTCEDGCLPRYLCFTAVPRLTGTGTPCCTDGIFARLMPKGPPTCGWTTQNNLTCGGIDLGILFVQVLHDDEAGTSPISGTGSGGCFTRISGSVLPGHLDFAGIIHNVIFTLTSNGHTYDCQVSVANMVPNPQAYVKCAPCTCVTCIPAALCLQIVVDDQNGIHYGAVKAYWDCTTQSWIPTGPVIVVTPTGTESFGVGALRLASFEDNVGCAILGTVAAGCAGGTAPLDFVILLEDPQLGEYDHLRGARCLEKGGVLTVGEAQETHNCYTNVNSIVTICKHPHTGTASLLNPGIVLYILDGSCNDVCPPQNCPSVCRCCSMPSEFFITLSSNCPCANATVKMTGFWDPLHGGIWSGSAPTGAVVGTGSPPHTCTVTLSLTCLISPCIWVISGQVNAAFGGTCELGATGQLIQCDPVPAGVFHGVLGSCTPPFPIPCSNGATFTATISP